MINVLSKKNFGIGRKSEYRNNYVPFDYYDFWITAKENENLRFRNKVRDYVHTPFDWDEDEDVYLESSPNQFDHLNQATQTTDRPRKHSNKDGNHLNPSIYKKVNNYELKEHFILKNKNVSDDKDYKLQPSGRHIANYHSYSDLNDLNKIKMIGEITNAAHRVRNKHQQTKILNHPNDPGHNHNYNHFHMDLKNKREKQPSTASSFICTQTNNNKLKTNKLKQPSNSYQAYQKQFQHLQQQDVNERPIKSALVYNHKQNNSEAHSILNNNKNENNIITNRKKPTQKQKKRVRSTSAGPLGSTVKSYYHYDQIDNADENYYENNFFNQRNVSTKNTKANNRHDSLISKSNSNISVQTPHSWKSRDFKQNKKLKHKTSNLLYS